MLIKNGYFDFCQWNFIRVECPQQSAFQLCDDYKLLRFLFDLTSLPKQIQSRYASVAIDLHVYNLWWKIGKAFCHWLSAEKSSFLFSICFLCCKFECLLDVRIKYYFEPMFFCRKTHGNVFHTFSTATTFFIHSLTRNEACECTPNSMHGSAVFPTNRITTYFVLSIGPQINNSIGHSGIENTKFAILRIE